MTGRLQEVLAEASETGQRAAKVRDNTGAPGAAVHALRREVVRASLDVRAHG